MPIPANSLEFIDCLRKSALVPEAGLNAELAQLDPASSTVEEVTSTLVRTGLLTRFQSKQLKLGRYKRFMVAGKYKLLELIGVGGMGAVYLCEHVFMRRVVAVKVLPLEKLSDPSNLERFYREARAVAALDHPNIVRAHDIDKADNLHFLVMEYVDGGSMQEIVARFGPLDPIRAANYIAQSAVGLQHAAELGMVHRDIKPGNLLLDRNGVVKILDMGLARFFNDKNDNLTAKYDDKCVLGTADYLAPEQALSNVVDIRADIYALGGTFYFMLTGQSPVPEGSIAQKLVFHQTQNPQPVTDFRQDVPQGILDVLEVMLRKQPEHRYQTPMDVAEALSAWTEQPISVPPAHEMPDLCPAVLTLMGHTERTRVASQTSRTVNIPAAVHSGGGSSGRYNYPSGAPLKTNAPSSHHVGFGEVGSHAQVPTERSQNTAPIQQTPPPLYVGESVQLAIDKDRASRMIEDSSPRFARTKSGTNSRSSLRMIVTLSLGLLFLITLVTAVAFVATR